MDSNTMLFLLLGTCLLIMAVFIFIKPIKSIAKIATRGLAGIIGIVITNFLLAGAGISVGINLVSALTVGFLGIPGFILLYLATFILGK